MKNTHYNTLDVRKVCEKKLGIGFRTGGECNGWVVLDGRKITRITVPKGRKPIPPKTYKSMARQLKLDCLELDALLDCSLGLPEYLEHLKAK
jgi:hypothetical protein